MGSESSKVKWNGDNCRFPSLLNFYKPVPVEPLEDVEVIHLEPESEEYGWKLAQKCFRRNDFWSYIASLVEETGTEEDFKCMASVNRKWRKQACLYLVSKDTPFHHVSDSTSGYLNLEDKFPQNPSPRLFVLPIALSFTDVELETWSSLQKFVQCYAHSILNLDITFKRRTPSKEVLNSLENISFSMATTLTIEFKHGACLDQFYSLVSHILSTSEGLSHLSLKDSIAPEPRLASQVPLLILGSEVATAFLRIRNPSTLPTLLKHPSNFIALRSLQLELNNSRAQLPVDEMLIRTRITLTSLSLKAEPDTEEVTLPVMPLLELLSLENIKILPGEKWLPSLTKLQFINCKPTTFAKFFGDGCPHYPKLIGLTFDFGTKFGNQLTPEHLHNLPTAAPNLEEFRTTWMTPRAARKELGCIFQNIPKLWALGVKLIRGPSGSPTWKSANIEQIFTGVSAKQLATCHTQNREEWGELQLGRNAITNLTDLEALLVVSNLGNVEGGKPILLSDLLFHMAFSTMKRLKLIQMEKVRTTQDIQAKWEDVEPPSTSKMMTIE